MIVVAQVDGARSDNVLLIVIEVYARCVAMRAIALTISCLDHRAAQMMMIICSYYVDRVIHLKAVGFLVHQGHP